MTVAATPARLEELKRGASMGRSFGLDVEIIDAAETVRRVPLLEVVDVLGAAWIPSDGKTIPWTRRARSRPARAKVARKSWNAHRAASWSKKGELPASRLRKAWCAPKKSLSARECGPGRSLPISIGRCRCTRQSAVSDNAAALCCSKTAEPRDAHCSR
ncbi:FAD-binding oxidoreductase [Bradyrhizobium sp. Arg68]|nr:FAD-binding oxidoreductase [Bradyrhizobium ivorense]